ncbi:MAG TPA: carboxylesterase family protein [Quisquiliibacterium sp.]|nr:carboxylesterase family protein [Quisquiliibacterium sp.]
MPMPRALGSAIAAIAVAVPLLSGCGSDDDSPEIRDTSYGRIEGVDSAFASGTWYWKGVPFAKPPVGELRWRAPVPPERWTGTRAAKEFGPACAQNGRIYGPGANNRYDDSIAATLGTPVGSEDCLTLNIWRPASQVAKLPVIVFVHGGSNVSGYTADPVYDGANLAKAANAVVVTVNYRLDVFGFFNLPQLKEGSDPQADSGNFALLDILQALRFVQGEIAAFGGDPGKVTLMGQSAGAIDTWALVASPLSEGLFHRAVPISGGISLASNLPAGSIPTLNPASVYLDQAKLLLQHLVVEDGLAADLDGAASYVAGLSNQQVAAYLRGKPAAEILGTVLAKGLGGSGPIPDGTVLPTDPIAAISAGAYRKVPILAGNTRDEGKLFAPFLALSPALGGVSGYIVDDATRFRMMAGFVPDAPTSLTAAAVIHPSYLPVDTPETGFDARTALLGEIFMGASRDSVLDAVRSRQSNVWHYQFDWAAEPAPWSEIYGAAHAFDLGFLFGNFGPSLFSNAIGGTANRAGRLALSEAMMKSLGAFAHTGNPNHAALGVDWPAWPAQLRFDATPGDRVITVQ